MNGDGQVRLVVATCPARRTLAILHIVVRLLAGSRGADRQQLIPGRLSTALDDVCDRQINQVGV